MGLFGNFGMKGMDWQGNMTKEQIDELEKQGCDVTELRAQLAQKEEASEAAKEKMAGSINLGKLDAYKATPRSTDTPFFAEIAGKPPLFGKDKWRDKFQNAELIYGAVVQANSDLWEPGSGEYLPAVVVHTNDPTLRFDKEWLTEMAEKISAMAEDGDVPKDCKELIKSLNDEQSMFYYKVGDSITGGVNVWCQTVSFPKQSELPNGCLPPDGIVPFLMSTVDAKTTMLIIIPGKYYM